MAKYKILFKRFVRKDLKKIPKRPLQNILTKINSLTDNPYPKGVEKLSGGSYFRIRQGVYRIIYEVKNNELIIIIIKVGHRKSVYRSKK